MITLYGHPLVPGIVVRVNRIAIGRWDRASIVDGQILHEMPGWRAPADQQSPKLVAWHEVDLMITVAGGTHARHCYQWRQIIGSRIWLLTDLRDAIAAGTAWSIRPDAAGVQR